jgi:hypothetical protein
MTDSAADQDALFARPFTLTQAAESGMSRSRLSRMLRERTVRRVLQGVYAHQTLADDYDCRLQSLSLVMAPHVIVCGRTAAWLYGVDTFRYAELEILPPIETCVLPSRSRLRRKRCKGGRRDLDDTDYLCRADIFVTSPLRTALDLGCELRRRDALATLDWFLRLGLVTRKLLIAALPRFSGRRGVIQLRELVALADGRAESPGESRTRLALIDEGLPIPELQWTVSSRGRDLYRLDLAYPKHRVCVEYDGEAFHDSPDDQAHDQARRQWLRDHGWIVIVVRKDDFTTEAIERWTREVRDALTSRHG